MKRKQEKEKRKKKAAFRRLYWDHSGIRGHRKKETHQSKMLSIERSSTISTINTRVIQITKQKPDK